MNQPGALTFYGEETTMTKTYLQDYYLGRVAEAREITCLENLIGTADTELRAAVLKRKIYTQKALKQIEEDGYIDNQVLWKLAELNKAIADLEEHIEELYGKLSVTKDIDADDLLEAAREGGSFRETTIDGDSYKMPLGINLDLMPLDTIK